MELTKTFNDADIPEYPDILDTGGQYLYTGPFPQV